MITLKLFHFYIKNHPRPHFKPGRLLRSFSIFSTLLKPSIPEPSKMTQSVHVKMRVDNIIKSAEDKREYRGIELNNGMKILLISDSTTDKSAAALDVNIGHMSDPPQLPGLAHFCEHMLFLGTKKYPEENEYSKFLAEHGGSSNACTFSDHTCYFFDVVPEHLEGALDRFAQFFLGPLFTESATEREVNSVNSEHEKNIPNDTWRLDQLEKHTAKKDHPYNKFGTGNKKTLDLIPKEDGIDVRKELLKFHEQWYSSNIMCLVILGKESLDELEKLAVNLFSSVEDKGIKAPEWPEHPMGPDQLKVKGYIVPVKDLRNLNITFPIPDLHEYYRAGPDHYLSHLIGHEGPGSLLSVLRAKGWCNTLVGGARTCSRGFGFFGIQVDLTEDGIEHVDDVVELMFQYIRMLREVGPQRWIFDEFHDILNMHFRFKEKENPRSYVSNIVHNLQKLPLEEVLSGYYTLDQWRPDLIEMVLNYLKPDNIRVAVVGKKFQDISDNAEPWYGTRYRLEPILEETLKKWANVELCSDLKLPPKNEFLPSDFDLLPLEENAPLHPTIIQDTPITRVWHKQDDEFFIPKANISFEFVSPLAYLDPHSCNMTYMFVQLFKDALNEYAYAAELAGLKWELTNTKYGMILAISGYTSKQHVLLAKIMEKLTSFKIDPKRFDILKENYIRGLKNFEAEQPYQHAVYYLAVLLTEHAWTKDELLAAAHNLTMQQVEEFIPQILSKMHIECLVHGNADKQDFADGLPRRGKAKFECGLMTITSPPASAQQRTPAGCHYVYEIENTLHRSSSTETYYQCDLQSTDSNILLELLAQIISQPCYNVLRTQEQLGYIVLCGIRRSNGVQGLRIIVQSDRHPQYLDQRVEAFLASMSTHLEELSEAEFERHREALAAQRLEKPKTLAARGSRYWAEITSQQYNFDRAEIEVAHLRTVTKQQLIDFYNELIKNNAPRRHKLSVHVISTVEGGAGHQANSEKQNNHPEDSVQPPPPEQKKPTIINNITEFKSSQGMFPLVQPYINIQPKLSKSKL